MLHGTDNDTAGMKAAHRYLLLADRGIYVRRLILTAPGAKDPADAYLARSLADALGAPDVAPSLAGHLVADLINQHRALVAENLFAAVGIARQMGPIIAAAPPEQWEELVSGAAAVLADAEGDPTLEDLNRELIATSTTTAAESWNPRRAAISTDTAGAPQGEQQVIDEVSHDSPTERHRHARGRSGHPPTTDPHPVARTHPTGWSRC